MTFRYFAPLLVGLLFVAPACFAQGLTQQGLGSGAPKAPEPSLKPAAPPPAAVPGARARPDTMVPADRATADLPPTEALFDAINRGDIGSARDALSRGADLDATNLLGLTPTELSVDLARNDITFLLLSLRGGGGGQRGPQTSTQALAAPPPTAAERRAARQARAATRPRNRVTEAAARPQNPALFAGNGGTANPAVGFLGFNPAH